jgi:hypothetical protein
MLKIQRSGLVSITNSDVLLGCKALSTVAMPELCSRLRLGAHSCQLQYLWPRPPYLFTRLHRPPDSLFENRSPLAASPMLDLIIA